MRLEKAYPLPPKLFGPQEDFYPDAEKLPNLYYSWRLFACSCGKRSGWRLWHREATIIVCSTECLERVLNYNPEEEKDESPGPESDPVSAVAEAEEPPVVLPPV